MGSRGFGDRFRVTEPDVLDVEDGLVEQVGDVGVVECVDHLAAAPLAEHQAEVAKQPQLVGDGRRLHGDRQGELVDRAGAVAKPSEDAHPARRR